MLNQPVEINAATELYGRLTQQAALRQLSIMDLFDALTVAKLAARIEEFS